MDRDECGGDDYDPVNPSAPIPMPVDDPVTRPVSMPSPIADDPVSRPVFMPSPVADDPVSRPVFMPSPIADDPVARPVFMPSPTSNVVESPTSNVVGPTTFAAPTAPSSGGDTAPSGGEDTAPTDSSPVNGVDPAPPAVTLESTCARYRNGTAPTTGNQEDHSIFVTLNVDSAVDEQTVFEDLSSAMRNIVGPSVLGCSSRRQLKEPSSRQLQDVTQMTNIVFAPPIRNAAATCTQAIADTKCIPVQVNATVFYMGTEPPMAGGKLRQALFLLPAGSITGFQGWGEIAVLAPGETPRATSPTTPATDRGVNPASEENKGVEPGKSANSIAFVAAAAGSLVVILAALFLIRKRRKQSEKADQIRELTDDEYDLGMETNDESYDDGYREETAVPKQAYVLNDEFSTHESKNGHEVYRNVRHGPYETCSSPSCDMCEAKRQEGTRFIVANSFDEKHRRSTSSSSRRYAARDTVQF